MTLDDLGERVGRPGPHLSLLENGKKQPRVDLLLELSTALGVTVADLLDPTPPSKRDHLEISLLRSQSSALFDSLDLPPIKPSAKLDNETLTHLVGLHDALRERSSLEDASSDQVRVANARVTARLEENDGYLDSLEEVAAEALSASGYAGEGPYTSRNLLDLTAHIGFEIAPIEDMPAFARSIIDMESRRIYIAQRDELKTRQARKAVLQTLAGFLLSHDPEPDLETFLSNRMETAYFATAVLAPEGPVVSRLTEAKAGHDIDVEDVKELFYVSYEMAAWRTVNLLTRHLGIRSHMFVTDEMGAILKGYCNDGVPVPRDAHGGMETQRVCRKWGARSTFESDDKYDAHYQFTDTPDGTFFCSTHVETGKEPAEAITVGVRFGDARWFRGRDTDIRAASQCPDPMCCRRPPIDLSEKWGDKVVVSARSQSRILGMLAADPYPRVDLPDALAIVDTHAG